jgi:hypothetical protein
MPSFMIVTIAALAFASSVNAGILPGPGDHRRTPDAHGPSAQQCKTGKLCGHTCIAKRRVCHVPHTVVKFR